LPPKRTVGKRTIKVSPFTQVCSLPLNCFNTVLPVRIINLETSVERRLHMQEQMAAMGLDYRIFPAVNGDLLTQDEIDETYSADAALSRRGRHLSKREIGCAFSHIRLYQEILDNEFRAMVILEDDVLIDKEFLVLIEQYRHFPKDWDIVFLGYNIRARSLNEVQEFFGKFSLKQPKGFGHIRFANGYMVSLEGASKLLKLTRDLHRPIDHYTGKYRLLNTYIVDPQVVLSANLSSTIGYQEKKEKEIGLWLKVCPWLKHCPKILSFLGRRGPLRGTLRIGVAIRYRAARLLCACNLLNRLGH